MGVWVEFYVAEFGQEPEGEGEEVGLVEGQVVAVHARSDAEGNPEWWLVENEAGQTGYAPANYLRPYQP